MGTDFNLYIKKKMSVEEQGLLLDFLKKSSKLMRKKGETEWLLSVLFSCITMNQQENIIGLIEEKING